MCTGTGTSVLITPSCLVAGLPPMGGRRHSTCQHACSIGCWQRLKSGAVSFSKAPRVSTTSVPPPSAPPTGMLIATLFTDDSCTCNFPAKASAGSSQEQNQRILRHCQQRSLILNAAGAACCCIHVVDERLCRGRPPWTARRSYAGLQRFGGPSRPRPARRTKKRRVKGCRYPPCSVRLAWPGQGTRVRQQGVGPLQLAPEA